jgi:hypothetical protein
VYGWYERAPDDNWEHQFDMFERTFMSLGGPKEMMLIADRKIPRTLYARLDSSMLALFLGFEPAKALPKEITFLIGHAGAYDEHRSKRQRRPAEYNRWTALD